jgi:hypothetical protein
MEYALVVTFSGAADRIVCRGTLAQVICALENLDYSGDFGATYITRNGVRIAH